MKKIILIILITTSLFSKDSRYLDKTDYSNWDFRAFIGLDAKYGYLSSNQTSDLSIYGYGVYVGMPVFFDMEVIINKNQSFLSDYVFNQQSLTLNIPLTSRKSRRVYWGVKIGEGKLSFDDNREDLDDYFYALHLGKRYKFTRNYHVRIEIEAIKYNYEKDDLQEFGKDGALTFNYGFEYRF